MTGGYQEGDRVRVRFPLTKQQEKGDRAAWPWLEGVIEEVCGPDEWVVSVTDYAVAVTEDGQKPPAGAEDDDLYFPCVFRGSSEIKAALVVRACIPEDQPDSLQCVSHRDERGQFAKKPEPQMVTEARDFATWESQLGWPVARDYRLAGDLHR